MTFDELLQALPNGLHDAKLVRLAIDYADASVLLDLVLWMGTEEDREAMRSASLRFTGLNYLAIEPPIYALPGMSEPSTIDAGLISELKEQPSVRLPAARTEPFRVGCLSSIGILSSTWQHETSKLNGLVVSLPNKSLQRSAASASCRLSAADPAVWVVTLRRPLNSGR